MNPVLYLLQKQWQFSKGNRKKIVFYYCLFLLANIFSQSQPLVIGLIINYIQTQTLGPENFWFLIGLLSIILVFDILFWVFHGPARIIEMTNAFLVRANYKQHLLKGTMDLPITWHNDHHSGDTIDKIEKGTTALFEFSNGTFWIIEGIIMLIISYTVLVFFNIHASYIVLVILGICVAFILRVDKKIIANLRQLNHYENTIASKIFDTIGNITTVVILRVEKLLQKAIWKKIMHPFSLHKRNLLLNETKWAVVSIISSLMVFLVLGSYVYLSLTTGIMLGTIYILYGYVEKIRNLFFRFAWQYGQLVKQMTAVQNSEEIAKDFRQKKSTTAISMKNWSSLTIKNLSFHYHDSEKDLHLSNISLAMRRGEKIAFIGESGSGKTTLLKIMRELYSPKKGSVELDGIVLKKGFKDISQHISLIPQDPEIFSTTIKENITLGLSYPKKTIMQYSDTACFTKVIPLLPKGLNSEINERGVNLSGGQKQRLALTRGLLASRDKELVLLDEPTSSVDATNERKIYANIFEIFKDKTVVSSIHRLHLLPMFDTIYLLEKGKIIAAGSFKDLQQNPSFKELWDKYKEESS